MIGYVTLIVIFGAFMLVWCGASFVCEQIQKNNRRFKK